MAPSSYLIRLLLTLCTVSFSLTAWCQPPISITADLSASGGNAIIELQLTNQGTIPAEFAFGGLTVQLNSSSACVGLGSTPYNTLLDGTGLPESSGNALSATKQASDQLSIQIDAAAIGSVAPGATVTLAAIPLDIQIAGCTCPVDFQIASSVTATFVEAAPSFATFTSVNTTGLSPSPPQSLINSITAPNPLPGGALRAGTILELESEFPANWQVNSASAGIYETASLADNAELVFYSEAPVSPATNETQQIELIYGPCTIQAPITVAPSRKLYPSAILGGAYNDATGVMNTELNPTANNVFLLDREYLFGSTGTQPLDGQKMSAFATVPNNAVDVVRLSIRGDDAPNALPRVAVGYGWVLNNGEIVDFYSGGRLPFVNFIEENGFGGFATAGHLSVHHLGHGPVRNEVARPLAAFDESIDQVANPDKVFDFTAANPGIYPGLTVSGSVQNIIGLDFDFQLAGYSQPGGASFLFFDDGKYMLSPGASSIYDFEDNKSRIDAMDLLPVRVGILGALQIGTSPTSGISVTPNPTDVYHTGQGPITRYWHDMNFDGTINIEDENITTFTSNQLFVPAFRSQP